MPSRVRKDPFRSALLNISIRLINKHLDNAEGVGRELDGASEPRKRLRLLKHLKVDKK